MSLDGKQGSMSETRSPLQTADQPDLLFALVAGLYVAAMAAPAAVGAASLLTTDGGLLYMALLAAVAVLTMASAVAIRQSRAVPERLGASRATWLLVAVPIGVLVGYLLASVTDLAAGVPATVGLLAFFTTMVAMLLGIALVGMSRTRYVAAVVDEDEVTAEWRAGWPEGARRRLYAVGGVVALVGIVGIGVGIFVENGWVRVAGQFVLIFVIALAPVAQERTYRVTPVGLESRMPVQRCLHGWESFTGYEMTDDALVLRRRGPWRVDVRCALADIEDPEAVRAALDRRLR